MAASRQDIKARIASVDSTKKITKAMQLVASSKLTRQRERMEANRTYAEAMHELFDRICEGMGKRSVWVTPAEGKPAVVFVITSDMGLCGGYNANVCRTVAADLDPRDEVVVIGSRGAAWFGSHPGYHILDTVADLNDDDAYLVLSKLMDDALHRYEAGEISKIQVLYTHYKNTLTFVPTLVTILPVAPQAAKTGGADTIYEPSQAAMTDKVIPMAARSLLYSLYLESKTSEQASRRMAMESATDNATELQEQLELEYNRIRQGAITQEITEIVSGANALV